MLSVRGKILLGLAGGILAALPVVIVASSGSNGDSVSVASIRAANGEGPSAFGVDHWLLSDSETETLNQAAADYYKSHPAEAPTAPDKNATLPGPSMVSDSAASIAFSDKVEPLLQPLADGIRRIVTSEVHAPAGFKDSVLLRATFETKAGDAITVIAQQLLRPLSRSAIDGVSQESNYRVLSSGSEVLVLTQGDSMPGGLVSQFVLVRPNGLMVNVAVSPAQDVKARVHITTGELEKTLISAFDKPETDSLVA